MILNQLFFRNFGGNPKKGMTAWISGTPSALPIRPLQPWILYDYGSGNNTVHALRGVNVGWKRKIHGDYGTFRFRQIHIDAPAGLDSATGGHIIFNGDDLTRMNDNQLTLLRRRDIGFIFQSFNLLPMFTAEQNILMPLTLAGRNPTDSGCVCWWKRLALRNVSTIVRTNYREVNSSVWPSHEH